jgi:glycosyltransferase involved in cell wall biosynthesis
VRTIVRSLDSILSQLDDRFEVIVVDGGSTDGTLGALKLMQHRCRNLTVISYPCSRGIGRGLACRFARGKYLIQGVDTDLVFQPTLQTILEHYHSNEKIYGEYALFIPGAFLVSTKEIMNNAGRWPDLQVFEDAYICVKFMQVCAVEFNSSLHDLAIKEDLKIDDPLLSYPQLEYGYIAWRDFHRHVPFGYAIEKLRLYLRTRKIGLPTKFGNALMFFLGAFGQYSKVRYKLTNEDLRFYEWYSRCDVNETDAIFCSANSEGDRSSIHSTYGSRLLRQNILSAFIIA